MTKAPVGYQPGATPVGAGQAPAGSNIPEGVTPAAWCDPAPSFQCVAMKKNGEPCSAHKVEGTDYCVGHIKQVRKTDGSESRGH